MATKKAKREAALKKREEFLAKDRAAGLAAQAADRKERDQVSKAYLELALQINARLEETLDKHRCRKCHELIPDNRVKYHPNYCLG